MTRSEQFKKDFEDTYGVGSWAKFCQMVYGDTKVHVIRKEFPSGAGNPMSSPTYYKWEARAQEVKA